MADELTPKFKLMPIYRCGDCNLALGCQQFHEGYFDDNKTVAPGCPLDTYGEVPEWLKEILNEDILFSFDNLNRSKDLNNKISNSNWATRINTVKWVLSLRKPEDNAP